MRSKAILVVGIAALFVVIPCDCELASAGYLYGTAAGFKELYRIDPADGTSLLVNNDLPWDIDGLASVPEPATLLLLGLAAVMLRRINAKMHVRN